MPSTTAFVRHARLSVDRAIHAAYDSLRSQRGALASFEELLGVVRVRAPRVLTAWETSRHPGVQALVNLALYADRHIRPSATWPGSGKSWQAGVHALAQHLLCGYSIPAFLGEAWHGPEDRFADAKREWFIAHGSGTRFRSLDLPFSMTRRMEHLFLRSHAHLSIEHAFRRAELLALGASSALLDTVLAARPSLNLEHSSFWRTVWQFMIANAERLDTLEVGPIIDFVQAVRHERVEIDTPAGRAMREPPDPAFSMRGRTVPSMRRLLERWHRVLGNTDATLRWEPSRVGPMAVEVASDDPEDPPVYLELRELTNSEELKAEGAALQHCVASYARACGRGHSQIWSLRRRHVTRVRSLATVEVDPRTRQIVQARGFRNARISGRALEILQRWAARECLRLAI